MGATTEHDGPNRTIRLCSLHGPRNERIWPNLNPSPCKEGLGAEETRHCGSQQSPLGRFVFYRKGALTWGTVSLIGLFVYLMYETSNNQEGFVYADAKTYCK